MINSKQKINDSASEKHNELKRNSLSFRSNYKSNSNSIDKENNVSKAMSKVEEIIAKRASSILINEDDAIESIKAIRSNLSQYKAMNKNNVQIKKSGFEFEDKMELLCSKLSKINTSLILSEKKNFNNY